MQNVYHQSWIPAFNIHYFLGVNGISLPLVILTSFLSLLAMSASWPIVKNVRAYCILFLLLETGMLGVFLALDFFLFYVFWEVMLLPMYFLIGIWGGPRREYAAIKFFLFTLVGSVLMLMAMLMLYFASDLHKLRPEQLAACHDRATKRPTPARSGKDNTRRRTPSTCWPWPRSATRPNRRSTRHAALGKSLVVGVPAAVHRLYHQAAGGAVPHLAARRPRGGAHADLDDPGRGVAEDGRLRRAAHLLSDLSRRRLRAGLAGLQRGRAEHGLRGLGRPGPKGFQAAGGLQFREPHGLRAVGHRRWSAVAGNHTTPTTGRWASAAPCSR